MKLIKRICKRCQKAHGLFGIDMEFNKYWKRGMVACTPWAKKHPGMFIQIKDGVPEECYYAAEQVVSNEAE